jgi:cytochrome bd-type quinol oxidase subunit 2
MYATVLFLHSLLRWGVLLAAAWATLSAFSGAGSRRTWTRKARLPGVVLAAVADLQLLLGLSMWLGLSPYAITSRPHSHYWTFLHPVLGIAVVALVHVGSAKVKRSLDDAYRWRTASRFFGAALLLAIANTPWPVLGMGRRLLPF